MITLVSSSSTLFTRAAEGARQNLHDLQHTTSFSLSTPNLSSSQTPKYNPTHNSAAAAADPPPPPPPPPRLALPISPKPLSPRTPFLHFPIPIPILLFLKRTLSLSSSVRLTLWLALSHSINPSP